MNVELLATIGSRPNSATKPADALAKVVPCVPASCSESFKRTYMESDQILRRVQEMVRRSTEARQQSKACRKRAQELAEHAQQLAELVSIAERRYAETMARWER